MEIVSIIIYLGSPIIGFENKVWEKIKEVKQ